MESMDSFLFSLGKPGRYQMIVFFCLWSNTYPIAFNNYAMVFYGLIPNHHCKGNEAFLNESVISNHTADLPSIDNKCSAFLDPSNRSLGTTSCSEWEFDPEMRERSVVAKWELVCDRKWLFTISVSIYFIGVMLGGPIGGFIADKYGRQPVVLISIYGQGILGIAAAFIDNFPAFIVVRFVQAILMQCLQASSFTLIMEMFQPKTRSVASAVYSISWTSAQIVLALVAWGLDKWWHVQLVISLPSIISFFYFWFVPESLRWLITHHKVGRAEQLSNKIAKFNKIQLEQEVKPQIQKLCLDCSSRTKNATTSYGVRDLVRTPQIRKYTFILGYVWFTASIVTYGVSYSLSSIASNIYLSFVISGCIELPIRGFSFLILNRFGRKLPTIVALSCSGVACIAVPIILHFGGNTSTAKTASTTVAIIGKAFMGLVYALIPIYTVELYPTVIRTFGQGSAVFFTRVAGIIAPQLGLLALVWKPMPFLICGICGLAGGLLTILLPDTHRVPMPDMIEDVESRFEKSKERLSLVPQSRRGTEDDVKMTTITNGTVVKTDNEKITKDVSSNTDITVKPGKQNLAFIEEDKKEREEEEQLEREEETQQPRKQTESKVDSPTDQTHDSPTKSTSDVSPDEIEVQETSHL